MLDARRVLAEAGEGNADHEREGGQRYGEQGSVPPPERLFTGVTGLHPLPVSATLCGLCSALLVNVSEVAREPNENGSIETLAVHRAPGASVAPHVLLLTRSPEPTPNAPSAAGAEPELVTVTATGALSLPR